MDRDALWVMGYVAFREYPSWRLGQSQGEFVLPGVDYGGHEKEQNPRFWENRARELWFNFSGSLLDHATLASLEDSE